MDWFKNDVHAATYAEAINTVPDESKWELQEDEDSLETPQMERRQASRPRENKRIPSRGEEIAPTICSRCHHKGHMRHQCKTTCPMASTKFLPPDCPRNAFDFLFRQYVQKAGVGAGPQIRSPVILISELQIVD
ncbi:hypothetical protein E3N88_01338 [Mikania micrantha]|uniref:Uncharacterized protein n=1 Tax=Mikania micrantha TaxID=192012 RepID=A0A5N6Q0X7_9ASTR|nr:hypothetical protein E3N88_01338 [Mikania micrantha]